MKVLAASLRQPRPEPGELLRRLPTPPAHTGQLVLGATTADGPADISAGPALIFDAPGPAPPPPAPPAPPARPTLTPISEQRHVLRVTVGREFVADLDAVKAAPRHQVPDGSLETILHECVRRTLTALTRRRLGTGAPGRTRAPRGRYVPAPVRKEVFERDGGRCTFVGTDGHRCGSTYQLQLHHVLAYPLGGPATPANLTLHCARHNRHVAEQELASRAREHSRARASQASGSKTPRCD